MGRPRKQVKPTLKERLERIRREGNLTVADLSRWFSVPYPTMRCWTRGTIPAGGLGDRENLETVVSNLERKIAKGRGFPVPRLPPPERIAYLEKVLRAG